MLQKRVLRAISLEHSTLPSTPLFSNLKIFKLQELFHLKLLIFVYECINKISPTYFHSFFDLVESDNQYDTRQASRNDVFLTHNNTMQYGIRSLRYCGAKMWNAIQVEVKKSPSGISFRKNMKSYLFEKNYKN